MSLLCCARVALWGHSRFIELNCIFSRHRLLSAVLRTSEVESRATRASLTELLSPQMGKDIMWFLRRWAKTYLLVDEKLYEQVCSLLLSRSSVAHNNAIYHRVLSLSAVIISHTAFPRNHNKPALSLRSRLSSDQHPPQHSVWCRHGGSPVDCGISSREGDQQPVCVELRG